MSDAIAADLGDSKTDSPLYKIRHSLAHVMAQAILDMRPGSTRGFGPPISTGFYYDFVLTDPITTDDFPEIERRMKKIIKAGQKFEFEQLGVSDALARLEEMGEPYKVEYAKELVEKHGLNTVSFYKNGPFVDMCEGPHVHSTRNLPKGAFKLRSVAGAYWRGDERNQMMTRIYAWCFETKERLEEEIRNYEQALKRDHKKLGPQLDLYTIDAEIGTGLPLWLPNGTAIRDELEKLAREQEFLAGYQRVATPHITRGNLYNLSGHLQHYEDVMYPPMVVPGEDGDGTNQETYYLRPMNCPHHHRIFAARKRSYRELPLRLAEYGQVYRFEESGALSGLLRVRGMCMNDAHIYCREEQIQDEFLRVMKMHEFYFDLLNIKDFTMRLSLWDPDDPKGRDKYVNKPELWEKTENLVRNAMRESGLPFQEVKGEAAFYGPKIDIQLRTVTGREETFSTNQLDFAVPQADRMNLTYVGEDGQDHHPYVIHRAPLGTHERFIAYLIEHFGGAFPTWLAPIQVRILPISEKFKEYAVRLEQQLRTHYVRAEVDLSDEKVGKKVREAITRKIPNVLVVGENEQNNGTVTLRRYGESDQTTLAFDVFCHNLLKEIRHREARQH